MGQDFTVTPDGEISDGHHTFRELYRYRLLYNAALFNEWAMLAMYDVHKSRFHHDGLFPFNDSKWFIVVAELPTGQISNHYRMDDWDLFDIPDRDLPNVYDGHTPAEVAQRLEQFLRDSRRHREMERLRCHLLFAHDNEAAETYTRSEAEHYHWQGHNGVGGLRSHSHVAGLDPVPVWIEN